MIKRSVIQDVLGPALCNLICLMPDAKMYQKKYFFKEQLPNRSYCIIKEASEIVIFCIYKCHFGLPLQKQTI